MAWLSGWSKRIKITIDNTNVDSALAWFPITLFLGTSVGQSSQDVSSIFDEVGANSKKIAITKSDGTTELYVEIEQWDSGAELAVLHVSRDGWTVTSASATEIYIYYDNAHADNNTYVGDIAARTEVWNSNFVMVQHMVDDVGGDIDDSTSNDNNGSKKGANEPNEVNGQVYKGQDFDGNDDYINCSNKASVRITGNITLEALAKFSTSQENKPLIARWGNDGAYILMISYFAADKILFIISVSDVNKIASSVSAYNDGNYHYYAGYFNGSNAMLDIDGGSEAITGDATSGPIDDPVDELWLGSYNDDDVEERQEWDGIIDEIRISNTDRSAAWIKATHHSLKDDLLTFGSEETGETKIATATVAITTSTSGSLTKGKTEIVTATSAVVTSTSGSLTLGKVEIVTSTIAIASTTSGTLTKGKTEVVTGTVVIIAVTQGSLTLGKIETVTSTIAITTTTQGSLQIVSVATASVTIAVTVQALLTLGKVEVVTATVSIETVTQGSAYVAQVVTATISISTSTEGAIYVIFTVTATISASILAEASLSLGRLEIVSSLIEVSSETLAALSALFTRTAIIYISTVTLGDLSILLERIDAPGGVLLRQSRPTEASTRVVRPTGVPQKEEEPTGAPTRVSKPSGSYERQNVPFD